MHALSYHKCPPDSSFNSCLTNVESVTCMTVWNRCFNMKLFVRKSSGEEILYLDKQCGPEFVCNHPDPNFFCNLKNATLTSQGHTMVNCTSRCCTTNMCNSDDLPPTPPSPSTPVMTHLMSSIKLAINAAGEPGNQTGTTSTMATPAERSKGSVNMPLRMTISFAVVLQWAFKLM